MQVVGYTRVSTEEQAAGGLGVDAQRAAIEREAESRSWELTWVSDEGVSGKSVKRSGLTYALALLATGQAQALVVSKMDRLSRSILDFAALVERAQRDDWAIICLDPVLDLTTAAGRMQANILAVFAQYERELISERTRAALAVKRANGAKLGRPSRTPADVKARIRRESSDGASLRAIADGLNADEVPTALGGKRWHASTVRSVLTTAA